MKTLKRAHLMALALVLALMPSLGADTALTREQMEVFLTSAKIIGSQPIGRGVTVVRGRGCPGTENERSVNSQRGVIFPIVLIFPIVFIRAP